MERKGFIGGSDCVKIVQGNWLELFNIKTGRAEPDDLSRNLAVQMGRWTEDFNLEWFEHEYDCVLRDHQCEYKRMIGQVPAKGTIDASYKGAIVEAKHTHAMNNMENVIDYYMPQVQLYCHLASAEGAYFSVIFGNNKWESAYVERNDLYFNSMWALVSDFWGYVVRGEEPVGIDTPTLSTDKIKVDDMVRRDAGTDNAFIDAAHTYIEQEANARSFEIAKKSLKQMVGHDEREVYCDLLTVKRDKRGSLRITTRKDK
jgi:predicted phage-related endonuclease